MSAHDAYRLCLLLRGDDGVVQGPHVQERNGELLAQKPHEVPEQLRLMTIDISHPIESIPLLDLFPRSQPASTSASM